MVSAARKLLMTEERRKSQCTLFWKGDYMNKGHNREIPIFGSSPADFFSVARKLLIVQAHR